MIARGGFSDEVQLREVYTTEADLLPYLSGGTLTIRIHHMANRAADTAVQHLCDDLNATETIFSGASLRLVYELVSRATPP